MLYHLSFNAREPKRVAAVLAEILDAKVIAAPSPPFNEGSLFVCCGDERGTMVSIEPWGVTYEPGPDARTDMPHAPESPPHNAFHALMASKVSEERIHAIAKREGWPSGRMNNGPFEVINLWLEGTQLLELTTPELLPAYLRTFDGAGVQTLDASLRKQEIMLREMFAKQAAAPGG